MGAPTPELALRFLFQLKTTTTAVISKDFTKDQIWLNGREEDVGQPRIQACLRESESGSHMDAGARSSLFLVPLCPFLTLGGMLLSLLPTQLPKPPGGRGMPISTARFGSGV